MNSWKVWLHSLAAAAIGGAASSLGGVLVAPNDFNFTHAGLVKIGELALAGALLPVLALLKQSPLPPMDPSAQGKNGIQQKLGAWALISVLSVGMLPVTTTATGCSGQQVVNEINVVLQQAAAVLAVAEPNAPWVPQLKNAIGALLTAEQTWQTGGKAQIVIDALNTIVAITAVIPVTAVYSPLIDVLVAGIEAVIVAMNPLVVNPPGPTPVAATAARNPHVGAYTIHRHWYHSPSTDFRDAWNSVATHSPELAGAVLK